MTTGAQARTQARPATSTERSTESPAAPSPATRGGPSRIVASPDGVPIALFESGLPAQASDRPTLVLVHGTTADHTTFRAVAPLLGERRHVVAIDRRGRGASGDGRTGRYRIELEYDDLAAVAHTLATLDGRPVDVLGHSYGGRIALGAARGSDSIRRIVVYEGAPSLPGRPYRPRDLERRVQAALDAGQPDVALETFFREVVGLDDDAIAAYRANPVWPTRVAAAPTILRELRGEGTSGASLVALERVPNPVLLVLGSASRAPFAAATTALGARLPDVRVATIDGAAHAAHHTHTAAFVAAVEAFLDA